MPLYPYLVKTNLHRLVLKLTRPFHKLHTYMTFLDWVENQKGKGLINDYYNKNVKYANRYELHKAIQSKLKMNETCINYFEFGVAKGDMIKFWASQNSHSESTFTGFDSFEGLPENWEQKKEGHFDQLGNMPKINDDRVTFVKGWFQNTVYDALKDKNFKGQSIFHLDADLFSSTLFVLFQLHQFLKIGDILIFDEFSSHEHEFLAFELFKKCSGRELEYELIGAVNNYRQISLRLK